MRRVRGPLPTAKVLVGIPIPWRKHVPSTPWRRRRTTDSPRPAGRRWAGRLRRGGTLARQALLVRVNRRSRDSGRAATATRAEVIYTGPEPVEHFPVVTYPALTGVPIPVEPGEPVATTVPLLPGEQSAARKL